MKRFLVSAVRWYQRSISPAFPARCRYYPSCSAYTVEALSVHGAFKGSILYVWRFLRCNPLTPGGVDHVPEKGRWRYPYPHDIPRFALHDSEVPGYQTTHVKEC